MAKEGEGTYRLLEVTRFHCLAMDDRTMDSASGWLSWLSWGLTWWLLRWVSWWVS